MNGHLTSEDLVLVAYGEIVDDQHLAECDDCRAELEKLREFIDAVPPVPVAEPGSDYEEQVWRALEPKLPSRKVRQFPRQLVWKVMAAAAALLIAFLAGRSTRPEPAPRMALSEPARQRILAVAIADHLERSRLMLTEWMNSDPAEQSEFQTEQIRARDLLDENRLYRQSAAVAGDAGLVSVLDDLERSLLDIAHTSARPVPAELKRIQERIEQQGTLFKVRVTGQALRSDSAKARL